MLQRFIRIRRLSLAALLLLAGCKATAPTLPNSAPQVSNPLPVPGGISPLPPVTTEQLPSPSAVAGMSPPSAAPVCEPPVDRAPWWKGWLPTRDQNDPTRERGQFKDGWYEPEFRGISD